MGAGEQGTLKYAFFPGCSLHGSVREYDRTMRIVCDAVGLSLQDIPDWSCCGASSAHGRSHRLQAALPGRNLFLAGRMGLSMATACPACTLRSRQAEIILMEEERTRQELEKLMGGLIPAGDGERKPFVTRNILEILVEEIGLDHIAARVTTPLTQLRVAAYYGCLLARPGSLSLERDPERPESLEKLIDVTGAQWSDWSYKNECCGGFMGVTRPEVVISLVARIIADARATGAEALVTACPLCFTNLDTRQKAMKEKPLPVFHFTELLGMAMGFDIDWSLRRHLIQGKEFQKARRIR